METESILPLADLMAFLRVDHDDDDTGIIAMREAARRHVEAWCGPLDAFTSGVPADLVQAMRLLVGHFYANREATSENTYELPFGFHELISPHRLRAF